MNERKKYSAILNSLLEEMKSELSSFTTADLFLQAAFQSAYEGNPDCKASAFFGLNELVSQNFEFLNDIYKHEPKQLQVV